MKNSIKYLALAFSFLISCSHDAANTSLKISLQNSFDEDLYIYLNTWEVYDLSNKVISEEINLSKYLIANKIIISNRSIEFNDLHNYTFIKTVSLSDKEPVFLEFNRLDSVNINLKINKPNKTNPIYIQLIAFSKNEINNSSSNFLVLKKNDIKLNLIENLRPFEHYKILDSVRKINYFDS